MNTEIMPFSFDRPLRLCAAALAILLAHGTALADGAPPKVGDKAPDFSLNTLDDQPVHLKELLKKRPVVLVVLRGWPGYQCPICDRQVHDFIASAPAFAEAGVQLVFVYPGPAKDLKEHAKEFKNWKGKEWPMDYLYVLDPDYQMVNAWRLRWNEPRETAYPSTFIVDRTGRIQFEKISHSHGDRTSAKEILAELKKSSE